MIVRLRELPDLETAIRGAREVGTSIRRAEPSERSAVAKWAGVNFGGWADEIDRTFLREPPSCFLAIEENGIVGFAAFDALRPNLFGPTGVLPEKRGSGIGRVLLLAALHAHRDQGYAYSIIGGVGPAEYYEHVVGAELLEGPAAVLW